jgi:subtilase family serine protease
VRSVCAPSSALAIECRALVVAAGARPAATTTPGPTSLTPADLASAYAFPAAASVAPWKWNGRTIAIVDAMNNPSAARDLAVYRAQFGLPPCTIASGCLRKVNQRGRTTSLPANDVNWGQEIDLDIEMASAVCSECKILLVEASSASVNDLTTAENRAATMHASVISNSWGTQGENQFASLLFDSAFDHPGIPITAATGDFGYGEGGSWPSDSPNVIAVGGTTLSRATNARGWTESAWSRSGSWCSYFESQPSWQFAAVNAAAIADGSYEVCTNRTTADVAADADPTTGVAAYDSYGSTGGANWYQFGGTSVSAPLVASLYALAHDHLHESANPYPARATYNAWYANHSVLNDVTSGSNGDCGADPAYLCDGGTGYDGPTGLGTPSGLAAF